MLFIKVYKVLIKYLLKCLITPICITIGVVLVVFVLFNSKISLVYAYTNMLVFYEPESDENLYNQAITPIVTLNPIEEGKEPTEVEIKYPEFGVKFAELTIEDLDYKNGSVFNCDDYAQLKFGWGRSFFSRYPGEGGKIVLAGHLVIYRRLINIRIGIEIVLKTTYGTYKYKVTETNIVDPINNTVMQTDDSKERLILYICLPAEELGKETKRFVVTSELTKGPKGINIPFEDTNGG